jgi:hypothetical protein
MIIYIIKTNQLIPFANINSVYSENNTEDSAYSKGKIEFSDVNLLVCITTTAIHKPAYFI